MTAHNAPFDGRSEPALIAECVRCHQPFVDDRPLVYGDICTECWVEDDPERDWIEGEESYLADAEAAEHNDGSVSD